MAKGIRRRRGGKSNGLQRTDNAHAPRWAGRAPAGGAVEAREPGPATGEALLYYLVDLAQRSALFLDLLRRRGDGMLEHARSGLPPLLAFQYETVLDARTFDAPAAYSLLRIEPSRPPLAGKAPVIVFDPRAGHGPGIGGFREESEVGMALRLGHPVYFVSFFPQPMPSQTLADVHHALRRFVAEVARRHPGLPPVLYGNCQAGWAVALLSADCQGVAGPAVLNGSPLSYWASTSGPDSLRLAGGLAGGTWVAKLLADLGDGRFDGAWLVQNFEHLDTAKVAEKYMRAFSEPEREQDRFLAFERWWGGFSFLNREEIVSIVEHLFVGNELENGRFQVCPCCVVDMRRIRNPLLIFASSGDGITPPAQALGWVRSVWPDTGALEAAGQRIAYLLHPDTGHLGIFVSSEVVQREHRAILANLGTLAGLAPGLYEMLVEDGSDGRPRAWFERRRIEDLPISGRTIAFAQIRAISEALDAIYEQGAGPAVRAWSNPLAAVVLKWCHPMRVERYCFASLFNPLALPTRIAAAATQSARQPVDNANPWLRGERLLFDFWSAALERGTRLRDAWITAAFAAMYRGSEAGSETSSGRPAAGAVMLSGTAGACSCCCADTEGAQARRSDGSLSAST